MVSTGCCSTLDYIVTYLFKILSKINSSVARQNEPCIKVIEMHPEILQQMLSTILNIIVFEDGRNQWALSRPFLGLILLNEEYFQQLRQSIIQSQPIDKRPIMAQWFDNLMDGVGRNLLTRNRDKYVIQKIMIRPITKLFFFYTQIHAELIRL